VKKQPKIVVIGAGSAIFGLGSLATLMQSPGLRGCTFGLVDTDERALETMTRLAEMMNQAWGAEMSLISSTGRTEVLPDADFVIVLIQVGQRETVWELDWQIPLRHGVRQPYAENGGPGSLAHTARNLPVMLAIAHDMEKLCPDAWFFNLTNPLIRLTWGVHRYSQVKVVGFCHQLLWGYAMVAAVLANRWGIHVPDGFHVHTDASNMPAFIPVARAGLEHLDITAAGLNHFSWALDVRDRQTGEDLYPLLRDRWFNQMRRDFEPLSRELFQIFGLMPTPGDSHVCEYLSWVHDPVTRPWVKYDLKLQSWEGNRRRRAERQALARAIVSGERPVDELRDVWKHNILDEGLGEVMEAIHYGRQLYRPQLNLPNDGLIPDLPTDAIVEVPGTVSASGFQGLACPPLPRAINELCRRELALSSLVVDAAALGDRDLALQAILLDPMVTDIDQGRAILDDILTTFREYLPQFSH